MINVPQRIETNIKVSGNIVSELSEKIPSNIVALNELIKNAYDAGSPYVKIIIDSSRNLLKIIDSGEGMNKQDIETLFHLSKSTKSYGKFNQKYQRYTQGSKGLGFLSVFKFGKTVQWKTKKDVGYVFSVDFDDLLKFENIMDYNVNIDIDDSINPGTEITINLDNYSKQTLLKYLEAEKNYAKIINSFTDPKFIIELDIDGKTRTSEDFKGIKDHFKERQLFYVEYNSNQGAIKYYHNGCLVKTLTHPFAYKDFKVNIKLSIYNFLHGQKSKIYNLFYDDSEELTPLIFMNDNFFNNFEIFDPSVMKTIKTGDMLNQMIGYINIYSDSNLISFNSDRTKFSQNALTDDIIAFLKNINITIQREGSKIKKYLIDNDFLKTNILDVTNLDLTDIEGLKACIKDDFAFKDMVSITVTDDKIIYKVFGKVAEIKCNFSTPHFVPAEIRLKTHTETIQIPSQQINLKSYIVSATDSSRNSIIDKVSIKIAGEEIKNSIIESVEDEKTISVEYSYVDSETKLIKQLLTLKFEEPTSIICGNKEGPEKLLSIKAREGYSVNFDRVIVRLIDEINALNLSDYREVIACSLRVLFELSIKSLRQTNKNLAVKTKLNYNDIEHDIIEIITFCTNKDILTEIDNRTKISFKALNNILIANDFISAYKKSNLGPHSSTSYLTDDEIRHIAKKAAYFVVLINEIIKNPQIN